MSIVRVPHSVLRNQLARKDAAKPLELAGMSDGEWTEFSAEFSLTHSKLITWALVVSPFVLAGFVCLGTVSFVEKWPLPVSILLVLVGVLFGIAASLLIWKMYRAQQEARQCVIQTWNQGLSLKGMQLVERITGKTTSIEIHVSHRFYTGVEPPIRSVPLDLSGSVYYYPILLETCGLTPDVYAQIYSALKSSTRPLPFYLLLLALPSAAFVLSLPWVLPMTGFDITGRLILLVAGLAFLVASNLGISYLLKRAGIRQTEVFRGVIEDIHDSYGSQAWRLIVNEDVESHERIQVEILADVKADGSLEFVR